MSTVVTYGAGGSGVGGNVVSTVTVTDEPEPVKELVDVRRFGRFGTQNDAGVLQAAIDASLGPGDPAITTRKGVRKLYIPAGDYLIKTPLRVRSALDFQIVGDGPGTQIIANAPGMECLLDVNGAAHGTIADITFRGAAGASVERALWVRWNGVARSTTALNFYNLRVRDLVYIRAGVEIGDEGKPGVQVDTTFWSGCSVVGAKVLWDGGTDYQTGFWVGDGLHANNLLHQFVGCVSIRSKYGVRNAASQVLWDGGCLQGNEVDFRSDSVGYSVLRGTRSEDSGRLFETGGATSYAAIMSLEDVVWTSNAMHSDGYFVRWLTGGSLRMANVRVPRVAGEKPKILFSGAGGGVLELQGVSTATPLGELISSTGAGTLVSHGSYVQQDPVTQTALTPQLFSGGGTGVARYAEGALHTLL